MFLNDTADHLDDAVWSWRPYPLWRPNCTFNNIPSLELTTYDILLMEEILHQLIGSLSQYLQGFIHPRWCRISSINSISYQGTFEDERRSIFQWITFWYLCWISGVVSLYCIYVIYTWNLWISSIFSPDPSKTRFFAIKTRVIWVPGNDLVWIRYLGISNSIHQGILDDFRTCPLKKWGKFCVVSYFMLFFLGFYASPPPLPHQKGEMFCLCFSVLASQKTRGYLLTPTSLMRPSLLVEPLPSLWQKDDQDDVMRSWWWRKHPPIRSGPLPAISRGYNSTYAGYTVTPPVTHLWGHL